MAGSQVRRRRFEFCRCHSAGANPFRRVSHFCISNPRRTVLRAPLPGAPKRRQSESLPTSPVLLLPPSLSACRKRTGSSASHAFAATEIKSPADISRDAFAWIRGSLSQWIFTKTVARIATRRTRFVDRVAKKEKKRSVDFPIASKQNRTARNFCCFGLIVNQSKSTNAQVYPSRTKNHDDVKEGRDDK